MKRVEIQTYYNRVIRVTVIGRDTDLVGKLIGLNDQVLVVKGRGSPSMIELSAVQMVTAVLVPRANKLYKRKLRQLRKGESVKQHLLDRHGMFFNLVRDVDEETARYWHDKIDHSEYGHVHVSDGKEDIGSDEYEEAGE